MKRMTTKQVRTDDPPLSKGVLIDTAGKILYISAGGSKEEAE